MEKTDFLLIKVHESGAQNNSQTNQDAHPRKKRPSDMKPSSITKYSTVILAIADFMATLKTRCYNIVCYRKIFKKYRLRTWLIWTIIVVVLYLQLTLGVLFRFIEKDFSVEFDYPQKLPNFKEVVNRYIESNELPDNVTPINMQYSAIPFLRGQEDIVSKFPLGLLIIVKSATGNYKKRMSIRQTWGEEEYTKTNSLSPELSTKVVFICGSMEKNDEHFLNETQYNDIVVAQFHDAYANNTYKTVLALRWATEYVKSFKYLMIVDDDMFINLTNTISFIRSFNNIQVEEVTSKNTGTKVYYPLEQRPKSDSFRSIVSLKDKPVIAGHLILDATPFRSTIGFGSTWSVSMEYPFNYYPPYIAGGVTIMDSKTVRQLYYGALFTKRFWIDDVYLGIIALKLGITLLDNNLMDSSYNDFNTGYMHSKFPRMIAMHGLQCPEQLLQLWRTRDLRSLDKCQSWGI